MQIKQRRTFFGPILLVRIELRICLSYSATDVNKSNSVGGGACLASRTSVRSGSSTVLSCSKALSSKQAQQILHPSPVLHCMATSTNSLLHSRHHTGDSFTWSTASNFDPTLVFSTIFQLLSCNAPTRRLVLFNLQHLSQKWFVSDPPAVCNPQPPLERNSSGTNLGQHECSLTFTHPKAHVGVPLLCTGRAAHADNSSPMPTLLACELGISGQPLLTPSSLSCGPSTKAKPPCYLHHSVASLRYRSLGDLACPGLLRRLRLSRCASLSSLSPLHSSCESWNDCRFRSPFMFLCC